MRRKVAPLGWQVHHHGGPCRVGQVGAYLPSHLPFDPPPPLTVPKGTLNFISKIEHAFVWSAKDTTTGAKCKVNWEIVCRPKMYGGMELLILKNLRRPSGYVGHGSNVRSPERFGWVTGTLAPTRTWSFSMPPLPSTLGMATRLPFGTLLGSMA
jgi:hypothetical protein